MTTTSAFKSARLFESAPAFYQEEEPRAWLLEPARSECVLTSDSKNLRTHSLATIGTVHPALLAVELSWGEIIRAGEETSLAFLAHEPDIYSDTDGEPV